MFVGIVVAIVEKNVGTAAAPIYIPDMVFTIKNGLSAAEAISKKKLIDEVLPLNLINPALLTKEEKSVKEKNDGLYFSQRLL